MKKLRWLWLGLCGVAGAIQAGGVAVPAGTIRVESSRSIHNDTSRPLREILAEEQPPGPVNPGSNIIPNIILDFDQVYRIPQSQQPGRFQSWLGGVPGPAPSVAFNGLRIGFGGGGVPPDTTGDVSPTHYFQWVNTSWAVFNKTTGAVLNPGGTPSAGNAFFAGFGGLCQTTNRGDPLVLWDDQAQRWVVSQFAFTAIATAPWLQCVAVSTTSDPLGSYHRYAFSYPVFNDYGKIGIWRTRDGRQNAYLLTMHEFNASSSFVGESFAAIERDRMLNGQPAQFIRVGGINTFGALPFHMEGVEAAPAGACPIFAHFSPAGDGYHLWDFCVDWVAGTATFNPEPTLLTGTPFTLGLAGIPQNSAQTSLRLDDFDGNSMYIAAMRPFAQNGPKEAVAALTHAVDVGSDRAGAAWVQFGFSMPNNLQPMGLLQDGFEDNNPSVVATPAPMIKRIVDQGTYAPGDQHRWMGSISIDQNGNLGMGYNVASSSLNPEIRVTARKRTDPPGTMRDEQNCSPTGTGAQTGGTQSGRPFARWGDYSSTGVDPTDECTFWHTGEYYTTTASTSWNTRICAFRLAECGQPEIQLEVPAEAVPVCAATGGNTFAVRVAGLGNVISSTTLSASGFPVGVTPSFSPNPVEVGGNSIVTLAGAAGLTPGTYSGTLNGVNGSATASVAVDFGVSAALAPAPVGLNPATGATGVSIRPTLSWSPVVGAVNYRVEISTSNTFVPLLESATVADTSYTLRNLLTEGVQYFWRVQSLNYCGAGTASVVASFTTGAPGQCPSGTTANIVFSDDVAGDAVAWVLDNQGGDAAAMWSKRIPPAGTGLATRAWYAANSATTADQRLVSPAIALPGTQRPLFLAFDAYHQYEVDGSVNCWDGGHVEISTDAGANWQPLGNERTLRDPYPGVLSSGNPAQGNQAWCRQPVAGTPIRTVFTLDDFEGQSVLLRFRSTADSNTVGGTPNGWGVDNIEVRGCQPVP